MPFSSCLQSFPASCIFSRVGFLHQVAKVLELQLQYHSFQCIPRTDLLYDGLVGSPCSPRDSQESSPSPHFKSIKTLELRIFVYLWPIIFLLSLHLIGPWILPKMNEQIFAKIDPTAEASGCMSTLSMGWGPSLFDLQEAFLCMCRQRSLP